MKIPIQIPSLGESIVEVVIGQVFVESGKSVKMDSELLELETDKLNQTLYAPQTGQIELKVKTGDIVKVGDTIGFIEASAEQPIKSPPKEPQPPKAAAKEALPSPQPSLEKGSQRESKTNFVESLKKPVEQKEMAPPPKEVAQPAARKEEFTPSRETRRPMSQVRRIIAARMVESQKEMAILTTFNEADLDALMALREKYKESFQKKYDLKLGLMPFFVKAAVSALKAFPQVNSYIEGEELVQRNYYDIGIAVGTEKGTIVPVVRNCDALSFAEIEAEIQKFAKQAREGGLKIEDLQGAGFTITNGGVYGSLLSTPIPPAKQCAILGMHKIEKRPVVIDDKVMIRSMMYLALSYDHRLIDGRESVSFLVHMKNILEDPSRLLIEV